MGRGIDPVEKLFDGNEAQAARILFGQANRKARQAARKKAVIAAQAPLHQNDPIWLFEHGLISDDELMFGGGKKEKKARRNRRRRAGRNPGEFAVEDEKDPFGRVGGRSEFHGLADFAKHVQTSALNGGKAEEKAIKIAEDQRGLLENIRDLIRDRRPDVGAAP
jgi:hypothetical protein